jgi:hypothetical protein
MCRALQLMVELLRWICSLERGAKCQSAAITPPAAFGHVCACVLFTLDKPQSGMRTLSSRLSFLLLKYIRSENLPTRTMSSNYSIPSYSPYSPRDPNSNDDVSQSPWSASSSDTGTGLESLTLPPINPDHNLGFDNYYDSLPRIEPPDQLPSSSGSQEEQAPPSNQLMGQSQSSGKSQYQVSGSPDTFEDFIDQNFFAPTPPRSEPAPTSHNTTRASSFVDLTESSPPPPPHDAMPPTRKRKADTPGEGRSVRPRNAPESSRTTSSRQHQEQTEIPEVVDLVDVEDDSQYEEFKAKQQAELVKQQQQDEANKPVRLAEFQCIICMDNPTDLTVTHCGKLLFLPALLEFDSNGYR